MIIEGVDNRTGRKTELEISHEDGALFLQFRDWKTGDNIGPEVVVTNENEVAKIAKGLEF